ncbi:MAG: EAL domain-containing protein, partial [Actinomycetota bacterium]
PIIWAQQGQWPAFVGWAALTAAGMVGTAMAAERALRRRRSDDYIPAPVSIARVGIQRVRVLTAILIVGQLMMSGDELIDARDPTTWVTIAAVATLLATNLFGTISRRRESSEHTSALIELVIDSLLVIVLVTMNESGGFSWVLFALPIIEAAVRFRLVGALIHWMALTTVALSFEIWASNSVSSIESLDELEQQLDQLSVLFLFVIPAAYLAEQLLGEVSTWQKATGQAVERSDLLARVADVGRDVVRLDGGHVDAILSGVRSLGFRRADLVMDDHRTGWRVVAGDPLPHPGDAASGLRDADVQLRGVIITDDDPDADDAEALAAYELSALVAQVVSEHDGRRLVLRAAVDVGDPMGPENVEAFRLLAGQASVALQNDQLMTEITAVHDELEHQALHDALTGLPNRANMLHRLHEVQSHGRRPTVLFLDLNGFKPVNDRLGHDVGDLLLRHVAERLRAATPSTGLVARLGGDEFTVLLTDVDDDDTITLARDIATSIAKPFGTNDDTVHVTASIGIAHGGDDIESAELIRRADVAMYEAKHGPGPGPLEVYHPELDAAADRRAELANDIRRDLEAGTIGVALQPVVDVTGRHRIVGAEALLRWVHPTYGSIPPGEAIETARNAELAERLNRHIVFRACEWVAEARRRTGKLDLFVAVNASPEELSTSALPGNVATAAKHAGIPTENVVVEISERVVTPVTETAKSNMSDLQTMGVRLLLDDFGEGTTSLTYLQELPIDGVKLDRRLVVNSLRSRTDRLVLESIVELSERIGHTVIAEGIENAEHLDAIVRAGCWLAQGYHLAEPLSGDEVTERILAELGQDPTVDPLASVSPDWTTPFVDPSSMVHVDPFDDDLPLLPTGARQPAPQARPRGVTRPDRPADGALPPPSAEGRLG